MIIFSQKHSIFNQLIQKKPKHKKMAVFLKSYTTTTISICHHFLFSINCSILSLKCWQNSAFCLQNKILAYYNLLLLAYSKEKKRAATLLYTQREKKKNPPEKKTIFLRNCNPFLFPFFARRSFLAQLNALFKNIKKSRNHPLYKSFGAWKDVARSGPFLIF